MFLQDLSHGAESTITVSSQALSEDLAFQIPLDNMLHYSCLINKATVLEQMWIIWISFGGDNTLYLYLWLNMHWLLVHQQIMHCLSTHWLIVLLIRYTLIKSSSMVSMRHTPGLVVVWLPHRLWNSCPLLASTTVKQIIIGEVTAAAWFEVLLFCCFFFLICYGSEKCCCCKQRALKTLTFTSLMLCNFWCILLIHPNVFPFFATAIILISMEEFAVSKWIRWSINHHSYFELVFLFCFILFYFLRCWQTLKREPKISSTQVCLWPMRCTCFLFLLGNRKWHLVKEH